MIGAFALRSPAPAAAPGDSPTPLSGAPPLVLDLPAKPKGGEAALAAVAADMRAGRRVAGRGRAARAPASCSARAICACRSPGALLRYRPGEEDTAIGVLRALVVERRSRARAGAPPRPRAALVRAARARRRRELEATRSLDPDGLYGRTADDVLHPSLPQGLSALGELAARRQGSLAQLRARAVAAPRSLRAQLDYAYALQFASRTRARLVAERALALDASNIDAQVAVIVLGFDKDVPAQAVGRLGQLMQDRARAPSPRFHFGELLSWIGAGRARRRSEYRQAAAARSDRPDRALRAQRPAGRRELIFDDHEKEMARRGANLGGMSTLTSSPLDLDERVLAALAMTTSPSTWRRSR